MLSHIFNFLDLFENHLWGYVCVPLLLFVGIYLTIKARFYQILHLPTVLRDFLRLMRSRGGDERGVHPIQAFFASVGGCVGVGNIVGICTAVQIGGPGALLWIWITAIFGMMIKYGEVFLGLKYRVANQQGGYDGGPMYFLAKAFKQPWIPGFVALLLCVYGVEVYQFSVVTDSIVNNWNFNRYLVVAVLLALVLFASSGGVKRVGKISSAVIPIFVILYMGMGLWVLANHVSQIPDVLVNVFSSAFSGSAALGGFIGSTFMLTVSQGVRRGCYTGDLGVGYASVIHSESKLKNPEAQASLAIVDIFLDTFLICTTSVMLILTTDTWHHGLEASMLVQNALGQHFGYMQFFMPFFLFLLGYSTINAYFCVGLKCADFISPRLGKKIYFAYAIFALVLFSFIGSEQAQSIMTIANGLLLVMNCWGIFRLRHEITFASRKQPALQEAAS